MGLVPVAVQRLPFVVQWTRIVRAMRWLRTVVARLDGGRGDGVGGGGWRLALCLALTRLPIERFASVGAGVERIVVDRAMAATLARPSALLYAILFAQFNVVVDRNLLLQCDDFVIGRIERTTQVNNGLVQ